MRARYVDVEYVYETKRFVEGKFLLDDANRTAYRNAISDEERHDIIASLVESEVHASVGTGALTRTINFQLVAQEDEA